MRGVNCLPKRKSKKGSNRFWSGKNIGKVYRKSRSVARKTKRTGLKVLKFIDKSMESLWK